MAFTALEGGQTTGPVFGPGEDTPHGGGLYRVLRKNAGPHPIILEAEVDGEWVPTGCQWTRQGSSLVHLTAHVRHRITTLAAGATVLLVPVDRFARGPAF